MADLIERLRSVPPCNGCGEYPGGDIAQIMDIAADRIEALEKDLNAVLRREEDANRAAMKHLRALENERIKSRNYAEFSHEWRRRCEALEAQVRAADALADLLDEAVYILGQHRVTAPVVVEGRQAVTAYRATKEGGA